MLGYLQVGNARTDQSGPIAVKGFRACSSASSRLPPPGPSEAPFLSIVESFVKSHFARRHAFGSPARARAPAPSRGAYVRACASKDNPSMAAGVGTPGRSWSVGSGAGVGTNSPNITTPTGARGGGGGALERGSPMMPLLTLCELSPLSDGQGEEAGEECVSSPGEWPTPPVCLLGCCCGFD